MRLFVAVNPPTRLREELATRLDTVRQRLRIAWIHPDAWHLTLAFLGDWPDERLPGLGLALRTDLAAHGSFLIHPGGTGMFPGPERPRVLFLQMDGGAALRNLANDLRRTVDAVWREGPQDHKHFRPHLTVARIKHPLAGAELARLQALDLGGFEAFEVQGVALMASELRPDGARHTLVEALRFGGGSGPANGGAKI